MKHEWLLLSVLTCCVTASAQPKQASQFNEALTKLEKNYSESMGALQPLRPSSLPEAKGPAPKAVHPSSPDSSPGMDFLPSPAPSPRWTAAPCDQAYAASTVEDILATTREGLEGEFPGPEKEGARAYLRSSFPTPETEFSPECYGLTRIVPARKLDALNARVEDFVRDVKKKGNDKMVLSIMSEPAQADIELLYPNGHNVQKGHGTPDTLLGIDRGIYWLVLKRKGFKDGELPKLDLWNPKGTAVHVSCTLQLLDSPINSSCHEEWKKR